MGAAEHVERLVEVAGVGQRAAIGAKQRHVVRIADRGLLQHRDRLGALFGGAQRPRIIEGRFGIAGIFAIALAPDFERLPPFGFAARRIGTGAPMEPVVSSPVVLQPAADSASSGRDSGRGKQAGDALGFKSRSKGHRNSGGWRSSGISEQ